MDGRPKQTFLQRHTDGQEAHEKTLNITNDYRNANQNHMSYHLTSVRMAIIKKHLNNTCWRGCGENENLLHYWRECELVQPLWRTVWRFLKKTKNSPTLYDQAIPLLGIYSEKTITQKDSCTPMFIPALFKIARTWKQPKCPSTEELIKKMWYMQTMGYHSAIKKIE